MLLWRHLLSLSIVLCWLSVLSSAQAAHAKEENETDSSDLDSATAEDGIDEVDLEVVDTHPVAKQTSEASKSQLTLDSPLVQSFSSTLEAHTATLPQRAAFSEELPPIVFSDDDSELATEDVSYAASVPSVDALLLAPVLSESVLSESDLKTDALINSELQATDFQGTNPQAVALEPQVQGSQIIEVESVESSSVELPSSLMVLPVGMDVGDRNVIPSALVKGTETGDNVSQWLLPFESVKQALELTVDVLEDGEWELRSPGLAVRLSPEALTTDADIGLAISVEQVNRLLGVPTQFEQLNYAIRFDPPWLDIRQSTRAVAERPILTEGLSTFQPSSFSVSGVSQQISVDGQAGEATQTQGSFSSLGTAFGGSWYVQAEQPTLGATSSWHISEFQYLRQTNDADVVVGSQPTFWNARSQSGDYWGASYVQRWGFDPPEVRGTGGFSPRQRLQAAAVGRTITGEAEPGTLVQLTQGFRDVVVDEVLVDSSGIYRFENVVSGRQAGGYQVLLYPNGQLTAIPEVQSASFSTLPGQLPVGASALLVSSGVNRQADSLSVVAFLGALTVLGVALLTVGG